MQYAFANVPAAIATKSGAAHKAKLARIERKLNAEFPGRFFDLRARRLNGEHQILIGASERFFFADWADEALRAAFRAAV